MPAQAPERQVVLNMITPIVGDRLVAVTKSYETNKEIPDFGTPMSEMFGLGSAERYKDYVFIFIEPQAKDDRQGLYTCYFAAPREDEDAYNWEFTSADIGNTKFDAVSRTYVIPRADYDPTTPAMGAAMPDVPEDRFPGDYVLAVKSQQRLDKTFDSYFVVETLVYVKKSATTDIGYDDLTGEPLTSTTTIYHKDEIVPGTSPAKTAAQIFAAPSSSFWGVQATGIAVTGRQLSAEFYQISHEQLVGGTFAGGGISIADYLTTEDYFWPAVLDHFNIATYTLKKGGGEEYYIEPVFSKEQYRGPCKARVQLSWKSTPHTVTPPKVMRPLPVRISTPFFAEDCGTSLHNQLTITAVINNHPKYEATVGTYTFEATTPTDWPASILASDEQRSYKGGWLRTMVTIYAPSY